MQLDNVKQGYVKHGAVGRERYERQLATKQAQRWHTDARLRDEYAGKVAAHRRGVAPGDAPLYGGGGRSVAVQQSPGFIREGRVTRLPGNYGLLMGVPGTAALLKHDLGLDAIPGTAALLRAELGLGEVDGFFDFITEPVKNIVSKVADTVKTYAPAALQVAGMATGNAALVAAGKALSPQQQQQQVGQAAPAVVAQVQQQTGAPVGPMSQDVINQYLMQQVKQQSPYYPGITPQPLQTPYLPQYQPTQAPSPVSPPTFYGPAQTRMQAPEQAPREALTEKFPAWAIPAGLGLIVVLLLTQRK